jgi:hypothetical protein
MNEERNEERGKEKLREDKRQPRINIITKKQKKEDK